LKESSFQAPPAQPLARVNAMQLRVTLTINNDVVIDDVVCLRPWCRRCRWNYVGFPAYIPFPRALTGQDTILLRVTNSRGVAILNAVVYYKNEI
jgi:hypothetical protein